ncbi:alkaline phosphatase family protein [Bacillus sp. SCS-153A]|uniref:alkaline phosphatase family protein n=1 Tax=Rossellomorea sedimentorum TaxID=3115294 RepID=UPI003905A81E
MFSFLFLLAGCIGSEHQVEKKNESPILVDNQQVSERRVILVIFDSLMDESLKKAIKENRAPALKFFMENGQYSNNLISSYPTMSVTIDSSLLTGTYPDKHKIPGLVWFDEKDEKIITYGNGFFEVLKLGIPNFAHNGLYAYNNSHLSHEVTTIHEDLDKLGMKTASINTLIYRGNYRHTLKSPAVISNLGDVPRKMDTCGPSILSLGIFARNNPDNRHVVNRIGLNDAFAAAELQYLLETERLPPFTIVYLPENDHPVHKKGPEELSGVEKADKHLQEILNSFPKWEDALEQTVWMIMGDSSQSAVMDDKKKASIDLRKILRDYHVLDLGASVTKKDDIVITANERMAYIYSLNEKVPLEELAEELKKDSRIAWISWKSKGKAKLISPDSDGHFEFTSGGPFKDAYQQEWSIEGNPDILDLTIKDTNISFGDYPDGLSRLYGALHSQKGEFLIVDAKPGYEFIGESSPEHTGGGAHGSMHKVDSLSPLIVSGTDKSTENLRLVDVKKWVLELLNE